jgi:hypothetical protein
MTLDELTWVSSGEASRTLARLEASEAKAAGNLGTVRKKHWFAELKKNRRKGWK